MADKTLNSKTYFKTSTEANAKTVGGNYASVTASTTKEVLSSGALNVFNCDVNKEKIDYADNQLVGESHLSQNRYKLTVNVGTNGKFTYSGTSYSSNLTFWVSHGTSVTLSSYGVTSTGTTNGYRVTGSSASGITGFTSNSTSNTFTMPSLDCSVTISTSNQYTLSVSKGSNTGDVTVTTGSTSKTYTTTGSQTVTFGTSISCSVANVTGYTSSHNLSATTMPANNLTITVSATPNKYTITLNGNGATTAGTASVLVTYASETSAISITKPQKKYTISYIPNGGSDVTAQTNTWTFNGFYTSASGGTQIIGSDGKWTSNMTNTKFSANTTLYAQWTATTTNLSFTSTKAGYDFVEWNTKDDFTGTSYTSTGTKSVSGLTSNITLYAQWTEALQTIHWVMNKFKSDGTIDNTTDYTTTQVLTNSAITTPATNPTWTGYSFLGWSTSATSSSVVSKSGTASTTLTTICPIGGTTFYAIWRAKISYSNTTKLLTYTGQPQNLLNKFTLNSSITSANNYGNVKTYWLGVKRTDPNTAVKASSVTENDVKASETPQGTTVGVYDVIILQTKNSTAYNISPYPRTVLTNANYIPITIQKATPTVTFGSTKTWTYDKSAHSLTITASVPGTIHYGTTEDFGHTIAYSSSAVTLSADSLTNAGTKTIYVKIVPTDTENYNESSTVSATLTINPRPLSNSDISGSTSGSYTYNGSAQNATYTLKYGDYSLVENTDYTKAYSNNVNAGTNTAKLTFTGKGNYSGTLTLSYSIAKANPTLTLTAVNTAYRGDKLYAKAKCNILGTVEYGKTNTYGKSVTISTANTDVNLTGIATNNITKDANGNAITDGQIDAISSYTVYCKFTPNSTYSGNYNSVTGTTTVKRNARSIGTNGTGGEGTKTLAYTSTPYNGQDQKPTATVTYQYPTGTNVPVTYTTTYPGTDYKNAGTGKIVRVTGTGNFSGYYDLTFQITKVNPVLVLSGVDQNYAVDANGNSIARYATAMIKTSGSIPGTSGTLYCGTSTSTISGAVTISEKDKAVNLSSFGVTNNADDKTIYCKFIPSDTTNYNSITSALSAQLTIHPKAMNTTTITVANQTYTGSALTPAITVKDGSKPLVLNTDYTVSYSNNTNAGTATVTITGTASDRDATVAGNDYEAGGNYKGTHTANFTIGKKTGTVSVTMANWTYGSTASNPVGTTNTGQTITYTYYDNNKTALSGKPSNAGTYYIKASVAESSNYTSATTDYVQFSINALALTDSSITASITGSYTYNGSAQNATYTIQRGSVNLVESTDYTKTYTNNINAGTATLTFTGKGNYTGTLSKTFTIAQATPTLTFYYGSSTSNAVNTAGSNTKVFDSITLYGYVTPNVTGTIYRTTTSGKTVDEMLALTSKYVIKPNTKNSIGFGRGQAQQTSTTTNTGTTRAYLYFVPESSNYSIIDRRTNPEQITISRKPFTTSNITCTVDASNITYNGSTKTPTFTVTDIARNIELSGIVGAYTDTAVKTITGTLARYSVTYSNNTNAGTGTVTFQGNYNYTGVINVGFEIKKADRNVPIQKVTGLEYGSTSALATVIENEPKETTDIYYTVGSTALTSSTITSEMKNVIPTASSRNAGTYTIQYYVPETNNYKAKAGNITTTISKVDQPGTIVTNSPTYHDINKALVKVGTAFLGNPTITYTLSGTNYSSVPTTGASGEALAAGTYSIGWSSSNTTNYQSKTGTVSVTVGKHNASVTAPTAVSTTLTYNGNNQTLFNAGGAHGGTIVYCSTSDGTFANTLPVGKNAGTYNCYYKVNGDANHNSTTVAGPVQKTIAKANCATPTITIKSPKYTGSATELFTISGMTTGCKFNYAWGTNGTTAPTTFTELTGTSLSETKVPGTYYLWYTVTGTSNYNGKTATYKGIVTVQNGDNSITLGDTSLTLNSATKTTTASATKGGTLSVSSSDTTVATVAISNGTITVTGKKVGTCTITVTAKLTNYNDATATISVTVNDYITSYGTPTFTKSLTAAGGTITASVNNTYAYGGSKAGTANIAISDQYFSTNSSATSGTSISRFTASGNKITHTSMGTNVGYDFVNFSASNAGSSSKTATGSDKVQNAITSTNSSPVDYQATFTSTISGLTAAGGSCVVTATASHNAKNKYTSNSESSDYHTVNDTPCICFNSTAPSSVANATKTGGSSNRFSIDKTESGCTLTHSTMGTNKATDTATLYVYNASNLSSNIATTNKTLSTGNIVNGITLSYTTLPVWNVIPANGTGVTIKTNPVVKTTYTSTSSVSDTYPNTSYGTWDNLTGKIKTTNGNGYSFDVTNKKASASNLTTNPAEETVRGDVTFTYRSTVDTSKTSSKTIDVKQAANTSTKTGHALTFANYSEFNPTSGANQSKTIGGTYINHFSSGSDSAAQNSTLTNISGTISANSTKFAVTITGTTFKVSTKAKNTSTTAKVTGTLTYYGTVEGVSLSGTKTLTQGLDAKLSGTAPVYSGVISYSANEEGQTITIPTNGAHIEYWKSGSKTVADTFTLSIDSDDISQDMLSLNGNTLTVHGNEGIYSNYKGRTGKVIATCGTTTKTINILQDPWNIHINYYNSLSTDPTISDTTEEINEYVLPSYTPITCTVYYTNSNGSTTPITNGTKTGTHVSKNKWQSETGSKNLVTYNVGDTLSGAVEIGAVVPPAYPNCLPSIGLYACYLGIPTVTDAPAVPTKTGYHGGVWAHSSANSRMIPIGGLILNDNNVYSPYYFYPSYTANTYTIQYAGNGDDGGTMANTYATYDKNVTLRTNAFTYSMTYHYNSNGGTSVSDNISSLQFEGWSFVKPDTSIINYADGATVKNLTSTNNGTVTLLASWGPQATPSPTTTRTGYTFGTWTRDTSHTDDIHNKYLIANWTANKYYIYYKWKQSDGTSTTDESSSHYSRPTYNSNITLTSVSSLGIGGKLYTVTFEYDQNYYDSYYEGESIYVVNTNTRTFKNWKISGSTTTYTDGQTFKYTTAGNITLYAQWNDDAYVNVPIDAVYNSNMTAGYNLSYADIERGNIDIEENGQYITLGPISQDITLRLQVEPKKFNLIYNVNGGNALSPSYKQVTYKEQCGTLATPTRSNYSFDGWYTAASGGTKIESTTRFEYTSDLDIYAHWKSLSVTVTLNKNGGKDGTSSVTLTKGSTSNNTISSRPTKTGYTFNGYWTSTSGGTKIWNADGTPNTSATTYWNSSKQWQYSSAFTAYAQWTANTYTVTFDYGADQISRGTWPDKPQYKVVTYDSTYGTLPSPTSLSDSGMVFGGWGYRDSWYSQTTVITSTTKVTLTKNHTLYAFYNRNHQGIIFENIATDVSGRLLTFNNWDYANYDFLHCNAKKYVTNSGTLTNLPNPDSENSLYYCFAIRGDHAVDGGYNYPVGIVNNVFENECNWIGLYLFTSAEEDDCDYVQILYPNSSYHDFDNAHYMIRFSLPTGSVILYNDGRSITTNEWTAYSDGSYYISDHLSPMYTNYTGSLANFNTALMQLLHSEPHINIGEDYLKSDGTLLGSNKAEVIWHKDSSVDQYMDLNMILFKHEELLVGEGDRMWIRFCGSSNCFYRDVTLVRVQFNGNGGTVGNITTGYIYPNNTAKTAYYHNSYKYTVLPTATRTNYDFDGWYTSQSGGTKITESSIVNCTSVTLNLYAHWTAAKGKIYITTKELNVSSHTNTIYTNFTMPSTGGFALLKNGTKYQHTYNSLNYILQNTTSYVQGSYYLFVSLNAETDNSAALMKIDATSSLNEVPIHIVHSSEINYDYAKIYKNADSVYSSSTVTHSTTDVLWDGKGKNNVTSTGNHIASGVYNPGASYTYTMNTLNGYIPVTEQKVCIKYYKDISNSSYGDYCLVCIPTNIFADVYFNGTLLNPNDF